MLLLLLNFLKLHQGSSESFTQVIFIVCFSNEGGSKFVDYLVHVKVEDDFCISYFFTIFNLLMTCNLSTFLSLLLFYK